MKGKKKPRALSKSEMALLRGSQYFWRCDDPLNARSEIEGTQLSHRNGVRTLMMLRNKRLLQGITDQFRLKWRVTIELELSGVEPENWPGREIVIEGILEHADGHFQNAVRDILSDPDVDISKRVTFRMAAEVIGSGPIESNDFSYEPDDAR